VSVCLLSFGLLVTLQGLGKLTVHLPDILALISYSQEFRQLGNNSISHGFCSGGNISRVYVLYLTFPPPQMITMLALYILSMWYKRNEVQRRFSFFIGGATSAGASGSLLATTIDHTDGVSGY
jgi:hypothetical protein